MSAPGNGAAQKPRSTKTGGSLGTQRHPSAATRWPPDWAAAEKLAAHLIGGGTNPFDLIDFLAHTNTIISQEGDFTLFTNGSTVLDAPTIIAGVPPHKKPSLNLLALAAWKSADPAIRIAYTQGRAAASDLHGSLASATKEVTTIPYPFAIMLRAQRCDIQLLVAAAAFRFVTAAPTADAIDRFFEDVWDTPLVFTINTPSYAAFAKAFKELGCSAVVVKHTKKASVIINGAAHLRLARRDVALIALRMVLAQPRLPSAGATLDKHREKHGWTSCHETMPLRRWMAC